MVKIPFPFNFVLPITLKPNHLYPFPTGTTLIRGSVQDSDGNPIAHAAVGVADKHLFTQTSPNGDFVLYFPATQEDEDILIRVTPGAQAVKTINGKVKKGEMIAISIIYP